MHRLLCVGVPTLRSRRKKTHPIRTAYGLDTSFDNGQAFVELETADFTVIVNRCRSLHPSERLHDRQHLLALVVP